MIDGAFLGVGTEDISKENLARYGMRELLNSGSRRVETDLRDDLYGHLQRMSAEFYDRYPTGDVMARTTNDLLAVNYSGILTSSLHLEAQYSKKFFEFKDAGGTSTNIVDSPYLSFDPFTHYNAPYFDATDPEQRNNRQMTAALSYFLSTRSLGKHDLKVGFENYRSTNTGGNSQSSTNYVFYTNYLQNPDGSPALDGQGYVIPVFTPGESQLQLWRPVRGARIDITTNSVYLNDRWRLNEHWSFNLGARAEWASAIASS